MELLHLHGHQHVTPFISVENAPVEDVNIRRPFRPLTLYRREKATDLDFSIPDFSAQSLSLSQSPLLTTRMHTPVASPAIYTPTSE